MGGKQRTHIHPFLDPKLALESIGEVPRVPRAHLEVEFAQTIVRFSPPLYTYVRTGFPHTPTATQGNTATAHTQTAPGRTPHARL